MSTETTTQMLQTPRAVYRNLTIAFSGSHAELVAFAQALSSRGFSTETDVGYDELHEGVRSIVVYGGWWEYGYYAEALHKLSASEYHQNLEQALAATI
jgi:hypothetical protein